MRYKDQTSAVSRYLASLCAGMQGGGVRVQRQEHNIADAVMLCICDVPTPRYPIHTLPLLPFRTLPPIPPRRTSNACATAFSQLLRPSDYKL